MSQGLWTEKRPYTQLKPPAGAEHPTQLLPPAVRDHRDDIIPLGHLLEPSTCTLQKTWPGPLPNTRIPARHHIHVADSKTHFCQTSCFQLLNREILAALREDPGVTSRHTHPWVPGAGSLNQPSSSTPQIVLDLSKSYLCVTGHKDNYECRPTVSL